MVGVPDTTCVGVSVRSKELLLEVVNEAVRDGEVLALCVDDVVVDNEMLFVVVAVRDCDAEFDGVCDRITDSDSDTEGLLEMVVEVLLPTVCDRERELVPRDFVVEGVSEGVRDVDTPEENDDEFDGECRLRVTLGETETVADNTADALLDMEGNCEMDSLALASCEAVVERVGDGSPDIDDDRVVLGVCDDEADSLLVTVPSQVCVGVGVSMRLSVSVMLTVSLEVFDLVASSVSDMVTLRVNDVDTVTDVDGVGDGVSEGEAALERLSVDERVESEDCVSVGVVAALVGRVRSAKAPTISIIQRTMLRESDACCQHCRCPPLSGVEAASYDVKGCIRFKCKLLQGQVPTQLEPERSVDCPRLL